MGNQNSKPGLLGLGCLENHVVWCYYKHACTPKNFSPKMHTNDAKVSKESIGMNGFKPVMVLHCATLIATCTYHDWGLTWYYCQHYQIKENKIDLLHMNLFWIATLAAGKAEHKYNTPGSAHGPGPLCRGVGPHLRSNPLALSSSLRAKRLTEGYYASLA